MLSHRDTDHVGGAAAVLRSLPVRAVSSSLPPAHALRHTPGIEQHTCQDGQAWVWDGVRFEVMHPQPGDEERPLKPNAKSCVLRVTAAAGAPGMASVLLTGDTEAAQEASLLRHDPAALRSDVLLVPHHGSRTSSTAAFLDAVAPRLALVQAGYRSRYGHPAPDVLARYAQRGIEVRRSDTCGGWVWQGEQAACTRDERRRYWHHRR